MTETNTSLSAVTPEMNLGATDMPQTSFADATSDLVTQMTEGNFDGLTDYATTHLAPALLSAGLGLFVIFIGYLVAKYLMRVISR
ncbi:MAG: mechanosensitive ion channel family protein, partial [Rhodopirellula bahusiensis]